MANSTNLISYWESQPLLITNIFNEFKKDILNNKFFINKEFFKKNSDKILFNNDKWFLRPEFFCYQYYGNSELYPIILLINDIYSRFNFKKENFEFGIYAPKIEMIEKVLNQGI